MINKRFDVMAGSVFISIGAFFVVAGRGISKATYGSTVGPSVFPTLLGSLLILLSVTVIYSAIASKETGKATGRKGYGRLLILIAAIIVYIYIFEALGYMISTFIFLTFLFQLMERKHLLKSVLISALFSAFVYVGYVTFLMGNLPPFPEFLTNLLTSG